MLNSRKELTPIIAATSRPFSQLWSKKGLTPIIAVILLLMMTVAAAGGAFFWFIRIQSEMQGGTEVYTEQLTEKMSARVEVVNVDYTNLDTSTYGLYNSTATGNLTIYLSNVGNKKVPLTKSTTYPTTTLTLQDSDQNIICLGNVARNDANCTVGCDSDLGVKEIRAISIHLNRTCNIADDTVYPNDTLFYFTLDFSGITSTGGSFTK